MIARIRAALLIGLWVAAAGLGPGTVAVASGPLDCARPPYSQAPRIARFLDDMAPVFDAFPSLGAAFEANISEFCLADGLVSARGYFEPDGRRLVVDAGLSPGLAQAVVVHELRHAQQFANGVCPGPDLAMTESARAVFALEADASVASLVVAWRMRDLGAPGMWQALAEWPFQADLAEVFAASMTNGDVAEAASAAFDQWYARADRRDSYYVAACSDYLDQLDATHRFAGTSSLPANFHTALCALPDGRPYPCRDPG